MRAAAAVGVVLCVGGCGIVTSSSVTVTRTVPATSLLGAGTGGHVPADTITRLAAALSSPSVSGSAASSLRNRIRPAEIARCTRAFPARDNASSIVVSVCAGSRDDAQQVLDAVLNAARDWFTVRAEEYPTLPIGYPVKPDITLPVARSVFSAAATVSGRRVFAGKGVYVCNEIAGIAGPSCGGGKPQPDATVLVNATATLGVRQVWVRCGDSNHGFAAATRAALGRFVAKAHEAGVAVVCWDVPNLWDVHGDALRLAQEA